MRLTSRNRLLALALGASLVLTSALGACSKEEAAGEGTEPTAERANDDEEGSRPASEAGDGDDEASEASGADEGDNAVKQTAEADVDTAEASAEEGEKVAPRGDKARDRVAAARQAADPASDGAPSEGENVGSATEKTPPSPEASSDEADKAALLSPAERRKVERERRIAELKRRNEERRKARMAQVEDQRREAEVEQTVTRENATIEARTAPKPAKRVLSLKKFITQADLRKLVSNDTLVEDGGLSGVPASEGYNSVYFAPPVRSTFGVAVQVWKDKTRRDANVRFRRMRAQYANAEDTTAPTAKSFISQWDEILTLSFANLTKRMVVSVSCSTTICKPAQLLGVAKSISAKL